MASMYVQKEDLQLCTNSVSDIAGLLWKTGSNYGKPKLPRKGLKNFLNSNVRYENKSVLDYLA